MTVDWQSRYLQGDTPWDKGEPHPWLVRRGLLDLREGMRILVPGCGRGHDLRYLAARYPGIIWDGLDLSPLALEGAGQDLPGNARLHLGSFEDHVDGFSGVYDGIWEHTLFCAIEPSVRGEYCRAMSRLLVEGGWLQGVYFTRIEEDGEGPPWNCPEEVLLEMMGEYFSLGQQEAVVETFPGREGEETFLYFCHR